MRKDLPKIYVHERCLHYSSASLQDDNGLYTNAAKEEACEPAEDGNWIPGVYEVNGIRMKEVFEPLLLQYDVDLFLAGHEHCYERSLPVRDFAV